jgi:hypothetical protein
MISNARSLVSKYIFGSVVIVAWIISQQASEEVGDVQIQSPTPFIIVVFLQLLIESLLVTYLYSFP